MTQSNSPRNVRILRARVVLPMAGPPIPDGAVVIRGRRIQAVGRWRELCAGRGPKEDLGEVLLLPGLINAHCHLDYTHMAGQFPPPKLFSDWLKSITMVKASWSRADYAASWITGARMLMETGVTTVADVEAAPELLPDLWDATPLRVVSFLEMIGLTGRRTPKQIVREALGKAATLRHNRSSVGLSPHAPYSTTPDLLRLTARAARRKGCLVCTHVAESASEYEMFVHGRGQMFEWLRRSGRDMSDCGRGSPVRRLEHAGMLAGNTIAIHANYLGKGDAAILGRRGASVAHCPRSHAYFGHQPFPLLTLLRAGVNVCLGTDSLATVLKSRPRSTELNLFEEMRVLAASQPTVSARTIVRLATVNGARALGLAGQAGVLSPGALADLIALPCAAKEGDWYETILEHHAKVGASMIEGQWVIAPSSASRP